jgi:hypothetical protein
MYDKQPCTPLPGRSVRKRRKLMQGERVPILWHLFVWSDQCYSTVSGLSTGKPCGWSQVRHVLVAAPQISCLCCNDGKGADQ